jgi:ribosomal protein L37AE/L43A
MYNRTRRIKKYISRKTRLEIFERDNYTCRYCRKKMKMLLNLDVVHGTSSPITIDHVIPLSLGGTHSKKNLVTSCRKCNHEKASKLIKPIEPTKKLRKKKMRSEAELLGNEWAMMKKILGIKKPHRGEFVKHRPSKFLLWWLRFQNRYLRVIIKK